MANLSRGEDPKTVLGEQEDEINVTNENSDRELNTKKSVLGVMKSISCYVSQR